MSKPRKPMHYAARGVTTFDETGVYGLFTACGLSIKAWLGTGVPDGHAGCHSDVSRVTCKYCLKRLSKKVFWPEPCPK